MHSAKPRMANVVDNGKDVYHLGMVVKVLNDNEVVVYAINPGSRESPVVKVLNDNKVLAYAFNPERTEVREEIMVVLDDDKVLVHAVNPKRTE